MTFISTKILKTEKILPWMKALNQILIKSWNSGQELLVWNIKKIHALY